LYRLHCLLTWIPLYLVECKILSADKPRAVSSKVYDICPLDDQSVMYAGWSSTSNLSFFDARLQITTINSVICLGVDSQTVARREQEGGSRALKMHSSLRRVDESKESL
jgi:hypothetical protein